MYAQGGTIATRSIQQQQSFERWDNGPLTKNRSKHPVLWVHFPWEPPWIKARVTTLDSFRPRPTNPCRSDGDEMVHKLCKEGRLKDALQLVECMVQETMAEEAIRGALICLLKACARRKALTEGKQVHSLMVQSKCVSNIFLANHLIDMYSKCGSLLDARTVFNAMPQRNVFSWTAIISAYVDGEKCEEAIDLFKQMQNTSIAPDKVVFLVVLKACARTTALEQGKQIHSLIVERGLEQDMMLQNILIDMYAKCGCLEDAFEMFKNMGERDVVSWNALIAGHVQNGLGKEGLSLYKKMEQEGIQGDKITFVCVLKACADFRSMEDGKKIHSLILKRGLEQNMILQNLLIDMYAKCGCLKEARELFNNMSRRDIFSWNTMITGYAQNGMGTEALALYEQMQQDGIEADIVTFVCVLKACAGVVALEQGKHIHSIILKRGLDLDVIVQSTLVDMYAKCGRLEDAHTLFNCMTERDVISWNAMISGYAQYGLGKEALALYEQMLQECIQPNDVTYIAILSACNHSGLVEEGFCMFDSMYRCSGVIPNLEHYACMIDLLGRAGLLAEALDLTMKVPIQPDSVIWMSLLGAAKNAGNAAIGEHAFDYIVKRETKDYAPYLLLIDVYEAVGLMDKVAEVRNEMMDKGLEKIPGCSWIKVGNKVHSFHLRDEEASKFGLN